MKTLWVSNTNMIRVISQTRHLQFISVSACIGDYVPVTRHKILSCICTLNSPSETTDNPTRPHRKKLAYACGSRMVPCYYTTPPTHVLVYTILIHELEAQCRMNINEVPFLSVDPTTLSELISIRYERVV